MTKVIWRVILIIGTITQAILAQEEFSRQDVTAFITDYINQKAKEDLGVFRFNDARTGKVLELEFENVRLLRKLHGYGFFADVDFHEKGEPKKIYDLNFWVKPKDGKLSLMDIRIYKAPKKEADGWVPATRTPIPWWWIPATEHPGEHEEKRGWEISSAMHEYIVEKKNEGNGVFRLKDEKTNQELELEFVEIHNPVRKLEKTGEFFACTDFRLKDGKDQFYDLDFWLTEKDGKLQVTQIRIHKEPQEQDGNWIQMPRYEFENEKTVEVP